MKRFSLFILVFPFLLLSCSTTPTINSKLPETKYWIIPSLNEVETSYIGDSLLKEGTTTASEAIVLYKDHGILGFSAYHPAGAYKLVGTVVRNFGTAEHPDKKTCNVYQFPNMCTNGWSMVYPQLIETPEGEVYRLTLNYGKELLNTDEYTKKTVIDVNDYYFEQQLIYTGAEGKILKFSYREFADGSARPAFTIDATYDLSKEPTIRFKGAVLQIIDYDNQSITYKVLSGFKTN